MTRASAAGAGGVADPRATLVLGACVALALGAAADGVLLPHVDRAPPRTLALLAGLLVLGTGLLAAARVASRAGGRIIRARLVVWAVLTLLGGLAAGEWLASLHAALLHALTAGSVVPYHGLVLLAGAAAAAPVLLPMGLLLGLVLGATGRQRVPALLAGGAAGALVLPYFADVLLGHADTLRMAALVAAAAALVALEQAPLAVRAVRLPRGRLLMLAALGGSACILLRHLAPHVDLGTLGAPWFVAALLAGAAVASARAPRSVAAGTVMALAAAALPFVPGARATVTSLTAPGVVVDVALLAAFGVPLGAAFGLLLAAREQPGRTHDGPPLAWGLAAPFVLVPAMSWVALPRFGPTASAGTCAVLLLLGGWRAGAGARALLLGVAAGACVLALPFGGRTHGLPPQCVASNADGNASLVRDPTDDALHVAYDGRAASGRSTLQSARLLDVPLLLAHEPERVLVVATDRGAAAARALLHQPDHVDWLSPAPAPHGVDVGTTPFLVHSVGSERLFLAGERPPWDAIVLLPDPRARTRAHLHATVEFYTEAARRLSDDGLFCQWWDVADIHVDDFARAVASAGRAFTSTYVVMDHPRSRRVQLGILGTRRPLAVRPDRIAVALEQRPRVRRDLAAVGLDAYFVPCLVVQQPRLLAVLAPPEHALRDGRSRIGVVGGLREMSQPETLLGHLETWVRWRCDPMGWTVPPAPQHLLATSVEMRDRLAGWQRIVDGTRAVVEARGLDVPPFENEPPGTGPEEESFGLAASLRHLPDWTWAEDEVRARAAVLVDRDLLADAEWFLRDAVRFDAGNAELRVAFGNVLLAAGEDDEALEQFRRALQLDPEHPEARAAVRRRDG